MTTRQPLSRGFRERKTRGTWRVVLFSTVLFGASTAPNVTTAEPTKTDENSAKADTARQDIRQTPEKLVMKDGETISRPDIIGRSPIAITIRTAKSYRVIRFWEMDKTTRDALGYDKAAAEAFQKRLQEDRRRNRENTRESIRDLKQRLRQEREERQRRND